MRKTRLLVLLLGSAALLILVVVTYFTMLPRPFQNPNFPCPFSTWDEPNDFRICRIETGATTSGELASLDLRSFCTDMQHRFAESNLTVPEANRLYAMLKKSKECGFPLRNDFSSPWRGGKEPPSLPLPHSWHDQALIKKTGEGRYEVVYYFYVFSFESILYRHIEVSTLGKTIDTCRVLEYCQEQIIQDEGSP